jgi:parallel beta-helix repeat protein
VQGGVTGVDATGTVYVAAGTYAEAFTIAKPVTVLGPNDNISPNAGERVAEAVLQGSTASGLSECVALDSTGVVLRGLTFDNLRIDSYNDNAHEQITGDVIAFNRFVNVLGTPIYLRDGRNEPGKYSTGVVVQDNYIDSPASAGSADFNAGSGIIVMGAEALVIKDNVILSAAYNGIQLGRCNGVVLQNNTATGCAQPASADRPVERRRVCHQRQHLQHAVDHQGGGAALRVHQQLQSTVHLYRQYDPG